MIEYKVKKKWKPCLILQFSILLLRTRSHLVFPLNFDQISCTDFKVVGFFYVSSSCARVFPHDYYKCLFLRQFVQIQQIFILRKIFIMNNVKKAFSINSVCNSNSNMFESTSFILLLVSSSHISAYQYCGTFRGFARANFFFFSN